MTKKTVLIVIVALIVLVVLGLYLLSRPKQTTRIDSGHQMLMGTFARVVAIAPDSRTAKTCTQTALAEIKKVDELMSDYKSDSEISRVNRDASRRPVKVSEPTFEVLQKSIEFSRLSTGAFDITVGPLVDLWRSAADANSPPTDADLLQANSKVGFQKLKLDTNKMTVRFAEDGMRLDLGGIAKGYAIDRAIAAAQKAGATGALVDVGGDIRCFGASPREKGAWLVGLQDPNASDDPLVPGKPLLILKLINAAVATSGGYRRFTLIEGQKHSHILNAKTGHSSKKLTSVTIIAPEAITTDALATAVAVMGAEKGLALIESLPQTEAILITSDPDYKLLKTTGAEKYIKPDSPVSK
jgi:thiamine biosynthesis lipoprotein